MTKRTAIVATLLLLLPTSYPQLSLGQTYNEKKVTFVDDDGNTSHVLNVNFVDNKSSWTSDNEYFSSYFDQRSRLCLEGKRSNWLTILTDTIPINYNNDYSINATIEKQSGSNNDFFGIVFGQKDVDNYMALVINGNGYYSLIRVLNGVQVPLIDRKFTNSINSGNKPNSIQIWKCSNQFLIAINRRYVERTTSYGFSGPKVGFIIDPKIKLAVESLKITEYEFSTKTLASSILGVSFRTGQGSGSNRSSGGQGNPSSQSSPKILGSGTGFVVDKRGFVATNYHVIEGMSTICVCLRKNGEWTAYKAKVMRTDPTNDIAILKIDDDKFEQFANLPYSFTTKVEDVASDIFTLGYPQVHIMGTDVKYTTGTINAKTGITGDATHYQISAHIDHGNSGGPLFNSKGEIIGITDSGLDKAKFGDVNYAIKSSYLKSLADVIDIKLNFPHDTSIAQKSRVEQIKIISPYVALILVGN